MSISLSIVLFVVLIVFLLIGIPIAVVLGFCAVLGVLFLSISPAALADRLFSTLNSPTLMAIPFFLLVANLMSQSQISKKLVLFINSFMGKTRGGLNFVAVLACAFFSALSGPAPVTVIAVGAILYSEMVGLGYKPAQSAGLFVAAGSLGSIIPPSVIMIVYASIAKVPISDLFAGGAAIGIILTIVFIIICAVIAQKDKLPKNSQPFISKDFLKTFLTILPAALIPIIIVGSIYSKVFSPVQAGAVASVYAILIGLFVYRTLNLSKIASAMFACAKSSAMILFIIASANAFSFVFMKSQLSASLSGYVSLLSISPLMFLSLTGLIVIIIGTIIDGAAICVLLVPALLPIASTLGIDPVHFAMVICIGAVLGSMTPPVAVSIFAAKTFSKLTIGQIAKGQLPFFIGFATVYVAVIIFPSLSKMFI